MQIYIAAPHLDNTCGKPPTGIVNSVEKKLADHGKFCQQFEGKDTPLNCSPENLPETKRDDFRFYSGPTTTTYTLSGTAGTTSTTT